MCDHSGMCPIVGCRNHLVGENYDLCEEEFQKLDAVSQLEYERIAYPGAPRERVSRPTEQLSAAIYPSHDIVSPASAPAADDTPDELQPGTRGVQDAPGPETPHVELQMER